MKRIFDIKIIIIVVLLIILITLNYLYFTSNNSNNNIRQTEDTDTSEESIQSVAERKTILNTIIKTGEVKTSSEEKLELHTSYYLEEIYITKNEYIEAGSNILKYTNGTYLKAPYNCVITAINVPQTGELCSSKNTITIKATDTLQTTLTIAEDELSKVKIGNEAKITIGALDSKEYTGYVTKISSSAQYSSSGSKFTVTVEFNNDAKILIGMTAKTAIVLEKAENIIAVPKEAVTVSGSKSYITIINDDGTTKKEIVETGVSNDAYTEIKSGIEEGQKIQITQST